MSKASEFCAANSIPRKAHKVSHMLERMPCSRVSLSGSQGFRECRGAEPQSQPMIESTHARVLADYARLREHSWSTPGHQGGIAFTKHPAGRAFLRGSRPHTRI